jgi:hypothetical protein
MTGFCKYDNEISDSLKGRTFIYRLSKYELFKSGSKPWNKFQHIKIRPAIANVPQIIQSDQHI